MYKEKLKSLMQVAMHLCSPGGLVYWQKFLYEVLAIVKKLGILMYFLTLSCADLSWPYIINKLSDLRNYKIEDIMVGLNCSKTSQCYGLAISVYIWSLFQRNHTRWCFGENKLLFIVHALKFKKGVAHMPIRSYGFSNIQNEAAYTDILEKAKNGHLPNH